MISGCKSIHAILSNSRSLRRYRERGTRARTSSESSTNVDLHAGKIMHNTSLRRRRATAMVGGGHPRGCSLCSHKFAIMQMPRSSRAPRLTLGSLLYGTGAIVNAMVVVEMRAPRNIGRPRKRRREKEGENERRYKIGFSLLSVRELSFVILSAATYASNLFRMIAMPRDDYPVKCYSANDIFTTAGDICDALDERAIRAAFIVPLDIFL